MYALRTSTSAGSRMPSTGAIDTLTVDAPASGTTSSWHQQRKRRRQQRAQLVGRVVVLDLAELGGRDEQCLERLGGERLDGERRNVAGRPDPVRRVSDCRSTGVGRARLSAAVADGISGGIEQAERLGGGRIHLLHDRCVAAGIGMVDASQLAPCRPDLVSAAHRVDTPRIECGVAVIDRAARRTGRGCRRRRRRRP